MNKRKKQWHKEISKGIESYEKNTNQEYDKYGKIQRYKREYDILSYSHHFYFIFKSYSFITSSSDL